MNDLCCGGVIICAVVMTMIVIFICIQLIIWGVWVNVVIFNDLFELLFVDVFFLFEVGKEDFEKFTICECLVVYCNCEDCVGCHNKIDFFGFVLENYGFIGVWCEKYENGWEVDVSGVLFN